MKKNQILHTENLMIGYQVKRGESKVVSKSLSLNLYSGELVCLLGPNGVGKSTLLRTLAGMQPPLEGEISLMGEPLFELSALDLAKKLAVVLTESLAVAHLSVDELVALGRYPYTSQFGGLTLQDQEVINWALKSTGAWELREKFIDEISDGERQKVMIARALTQEPNLMLLDEPTAFLDLPRRVEVTRLLKELTRRFDRSILLSTHDLELALQVSDQIWLLDSKGKLEIGAPEDLVLNGALENVFRNDGVIFHRETGAFRIQNPVSKQIGFVGEGTVGSWTQHALQREGYETVPKSQSGDFYIQQLEEQGKFPYWLLYRKGHTKSYDSILELMRSIR